MTLRCKPLSRDNQGFTLIELLVVIAIIALLAAILFPVFAQAREKARSIACLSNERQIGLAFIQYVQDNDETYPSGPFLAPIAGTTTGLGWAGLCEPYLKSAQVLKCPDDSTQAVAIAGQSPAQPVSYGFNEDASGTVLSDFTAPAKTVLLFEITGDTAQVTDPSEGTAGYTTPPQTGFMSVAGDGDLLLGQVKKFTQTSGFSIVTALANNKNPATIQYATGALGGRWMPDATPDAKPAWFAAETGRHQDGSNFVLADGHARWSTPAQVSSGADADAADCRQGNLGSQPADCSKALAANAAGTDSPAPFSLTFSTE